MASRTSETEKLAERCGMTAEVWTSVKEQASAARTRGRRTEATVDRKLATWGHLDGQTDLFDTDE